MAPGAGERGGEVVRPGEHAVHVSGGEQLLLEVDEVDLQVQITDLATPDTSSGLFFTPIQDPDFSDDLAGPSVFDEDLEAPADVGMIFGHDLVDDAEETLDDDELEGEGEGEDEGQYYRTA